MRISSVRLAAQDFKSAIQLHGGGFKFSGVDQYLAEVHARRGKVRIEGDGFGEWLAGRLAVAKGVECFAQRILRFGRARPQADGFSELRDGFGAIAILLQNAAEHQTGIGIGGVFADDVPQQPDGIRAPALDEQVPCAVYGLALRHQDACPNQ